MTSDGSPIDIDMDDDEPEHVELEPWTGERPDVKAYDYVRLGEDPALDRTGELPPSALRGALVPDPERAPSALRARFDYRPERAPAALLVRSIPMGALDVWRRVAAMIWSHPEEWILEVHKRNEDDRKYQAARDRIREEMAETRKTLLRMVGVAVGTLAVLALLTFVTLLAVVALAVPALVGPAYLGVRGLRTRAQGATWSAPPSAPERAPGARPGEQWSAPPSAPGWLTPEGIARALKDAGHLKDGREIAVHSMKDMGNGWACQVTLPTNLTSDVVIKTRRKLAGAFRTNRRNLILLPDNHDECTLYLWKCDHDPLSGPGHESTMIGVRQTSVWKDIPIGVTVSGDPVKMSMVGTHLLLAGDSGSGKTFSARLLPLGVALDPHARNVILDCQGLGAWRMFSETGTVIAGQTYEALRAMTEMLEWLAGPEATRRRQVILAHRDLVPMDCPEDKLTEAMAQNAELNLPFVFITVDECHVLLNHPTLGKRAVDALILLISTGRALGISTMLVTQKPSEKNIPTEIRDLPTTRWCLSVATGASARMALGDEYAEMGMDPVGGLTSKNKGAGYLLGEGLVEPADVPFVLMRTDYVDPNRARDMLRQALATRVSQRPELLPAHAETIPFGPAITPAPGLLPPPPPASVMAPAASDGVLAAVVRLAAVFGPDEKLAREDVLARLQAAHPDLYAGLEPGAINSHLEPLGLRTTQLRVDGKRTQALARKTVVKRQLELEDASRVVTRQDTPGDAAVTAETAPDLGIVDERPRHETEDGSAGNPGKPRIPAMAALPEVPSLTPTERRGTGR